MRIKIHAGDVEMAATLNDTPTARAIYDALPFSATAQTWGDEIYFDTPVIHDLDESAKEVVEIGDLGYWPTGKALCIFFGPTPMSRGNEIRPASAVNIVGQVLEDAHRLKSVRDGDRVRVETAA